MADKQNSPLIDKLFSVGAHFGYSKTRRHPSTAKYIFGSKGGVEMFDLEKTSVLLEDALAFIKNLAAERKTILFVSGKAEGRGALERTASKLGQPFVASRWIGGTLTNTSEIKKRLARLSELTDMRDKGEWAKFTKLERLLMSREIEELELMFGGIRGSERLPNALFVIDPRKESIAVAEAKTMHIPVIALMNSDCDASDIAYPIPGNDASLHAIEMILGEVAKAFEEGVASAPAREEKAATTTA